MRRSWLGARMGLYSMGNPCSLFICLLNIWFLRSIMSFVGHEYPRQRAPKFDVEEDEPLYEDEDVTDTVTE